jgi:micrococcal nuclease
MCTVVAVACGVGSTAEPEAHADANATIERVVDGDTVVLTDDTRVRLIGIDTPETVDPRRPVECLGREASARLRELLPAGTAVRLVYDVERTDRYGRTLAYVYRADDDLFVNEAMAREGFAEQLTVPPNVAHVDDIAAAVADARQAGRGLWRADACVGT